MKRILPVALVALALTAAQEGGSDPRATVDAEREFRARLEEAPDDRLARYNLGTVLLLDGRYDEARSHLQSARGGDPRIEAPANYNLGATDLEPAFADTTLADREARLRRAIEAYKLALSAEPDDLDAKWNLELARRLLERETPPPEGGGGGGDGGGGAGGDGGQGSPADPEPQPEPAAGDGPDPSIGESAAEELLRSARDRELEVQRDRLRRTQPPGPLRP